MEWILKPKESIGPLKFGMTRKEVHEILGEPNRVFDYTMEKTPCFIDSYKKKGFNICFKGNFDTNELAHVDILSGIVVKDENGNVLFPVCIHRLMSIYPMDTKEVFNGRDGSSVYKSYRNAVCAIVDDKDLQVIRFTMHRAIKKVKE